MTILLELSVPMSLSMSQFYPNPISVTAVLEHLDLLLPACNILEFQLITLSHSSILWQGLSIAYRLIPSLAGNNGFKIQSVMKC